MPRRLTKEEFIKKAKKVYGEFYNYSKVNYINNSTKVEIICPIHGSFLITPGNFLMGHSCYFCGRVKTENAKRMPKEEFIQKANLVHNNFYDYSKVNYSNCDTKVEIICPIHGPFWQTPYCHLKGNRCPNCVSNKKLTKEEFIRRAKLIHGELYDYSKVNYISTKTKVEIICPIHGSFWQTPGNHLDGRNGCPVCLKHKNEEQIFLFLKRQNIDFEAEKTFPGLKDKKLLRYDFYIPSKNLLIEFNGEQHYHWVKVFHKSYHNFLIQKHHDWLKRKYAEKNKIQLLIISYKQEKEIPQILESYLYD